MYSYYILQQELKPLPIIAYLRVSKDNSVKAISIGHEERLMKFLQNEK